MRVLLCPLIPDGSQLQVTCFSLQVALEKTLSRGRIFNILNNNFTDNVFLWCPHTGAQMMLVVVGVAASTVGVTLGGLVAVCVRWRSSEYI